jgi:hypothetical protein
MAPPRPPSAISRGLRAVLTASAVAAVGAAGVVMAHHPMILSGLRRVQTDLGDTRLNNYILEHGYRWSVGSPGHAEFWSPPFFFPARNVAAYSDILLGVAPIYGVIRALGCPPDTSFQVWMIAVSALNYLAAYHLLRRRFGLGVPASCAGAFLFAFGAPRVNQAGHQQLLPQFLSLVTIDALLGLFPGEGAAPRRRVLSWAVAALGVVAQLYAGFYLGWFLLLALGIAAIAAVMMRSTRGAFLSVLRRDAPILLVVATAGVLLLRPLIVHYLAAQREVGERPFAQVIPYMPGWGALFHLGPENWLYGWLSWLGVSPSVGEAEKRLGIGLVTTSACAAGLYWSLGRPAVRLVVAVGLALLACIMPMPQGLGLGLGVASALVAVAWRGPRRRMFASALVVVLMGALVYWIGPWGWSVLYRYVPGASAMRAVSRAGLMLLIPWSIGLGLFVESMLARRRPFGALVVALLCLLEQGVTTRSYDKGEARATVAAIARRVDRRDAAFFYSPHEAPPPGYPHYNYQVDAMWAGLESGVPTVNGYSGHNPPDWAPLAIANVVRERDFDRLEAALRLWAGARDLPLDRVGWVGGPPDWRRGHGPDRRSP